MARLDCDYTSMHAAESALVRSHPRSPAPLCTHKGMSHKGNARRWKLPLHQHFRDLSGICWNKEHLLLDLVPMPKQNTVVSTMVESRAPFDVLHCRTAGHQAADESSQHKEPSTGKPAATHLRRTRPGLPARALGTALEPPGTSRTFLPHVAQLSSTKETTKSAFGAKKS